MTTLGWYGKLDQTERRTYWACFAGFGLDSMDSTIYALVIPALIATIGQLRGATIVLSFFLGAFQGALASGMLPTFAELFPTDIRASGQVCLSQFRPGHNDGAIRR